VHFLWWYLFLRFHDCIWAAFGGISPHLLSQPLDNGVELYGVFQSPQHQSDAFHVYMSFFRSSCNLSYT
jgi:hypothetical protein